MTSAWIICVVIANICVYIRKVILLRCGYRVGLFLSNDFVHLSDLIESTGQPTKYILIYVNLSPYIFLLLGFIFALIDFSL